MTDWNKKGGFCCNYVCCTGSGFVVSHDGNTISYSEDNVSSLFYCFICIPILIHTASMAGMIFKYENGKVNCTVGCKYCCSETFDTLYDVVDVNFETKGSGCDVRITHSAGVKTVSLRRGGQHHKDFSAAVNRMIHGVSAHIAHPPFVVEPSAPPQEVFAQLVTESDNPINFVIADAVYE